MDQQVGQKLEMWISARNLNNTDIVGKSDPKCQVSIKQGNEDWQVLGTTETIQDELNPDWKKIFKLEYYFYQHQKLSFLIVDVDDSPGDSDDVLAKAIVNLGDLVASKINRTSIKLLDQYKNYCGELIIHLSKEVPDHQFLSWQWSGKALADKDTFTSSDPMIIFYKKTKTDDWEEVYKSEVIDNEVDPQWQPFEIGVKQLCGKSGIFKIRVIDIDDDDQYDEIGEAYIKIEDIINNVKTEFTLEDPEDKSQSGTICVENVKVRTNETFIDYILSGQQLNLSVAIDFTQSNGNPKQIDSLHYISNEQGVQNLYESALEAVATILISYDVDKLIPVYGFGGVPKFNGYTKAYMDECFPLNGNPNNPSVKGVDELLKTYRQSLDFIELSGPTYLKKIIAMASENALSLESKGIYSVLLVLTDGQIEDMNDVIHAILNCHKVPLSIIIVGIGDENFTYMKILDDNIKLRENLPEGQDFRDVCQFVSFKEVENNPLALCQRVLKELPPQIVSYLKEKGVKPKNSI